MPNDQPRQGFARGCDCEGKDGDAGQPPDRGDQQKPPRQMDHSSTCGGEGFWGDWLMIQKSPMDSTQLPEWNDVTGDRHRIHEQVENLPAGMKSVHLSRRQQRLDLRLVVENVEDAADHIRDDR